MKTDEANKQLQESKPKKDDSLSFKQRKDDSISSPKKINQSTNSTTFSHLGEMLASARNVSHNATDQLSFGSRALKYKYSTEDIEKASLFTTDTYESSSPVQ